MNELFKQLPAAEDVTMGDKETIENAFAAYDALTGDLKEQLPKDGYDKLIAAKRALEVLEVKAAIENLPADDAVTPDDRGAIEAARAAYGALNDDQKKQISDVTLKKLTDAEDALAAAEVTKTISGLPQSGITPDDRGAIEAARAAYEKLTGEQKSRVSSETLAKLEKAEVDLATAIVTEKLNGLDLDNVTPDNADAIEAARAAYQKLTDEEKKSFPQELLEQLEKAEVGLATAIVTEQLAGVDPENVKESDKDAIAAARAAYEKLTDGEKKSFPQDLLEKLEKSELNYAILGVNTEMAKLPASVDEITTAHKAIIEAARAAYEALDGKIKEKFPEATLARLEAAEVALATAVVTEKLNGLDLDNVTPDDKDAIEAARAAYEKLTDEQKENFPQDLLEKLEKAEVALATALIDALPDEITADDDEKISDARYQYDHLSDEQKKEISGETLAKLKAAEVALTKALIETLPQIDAIRLEDKEAIDRARATYEKLSEDQKAEIPDGTLDELEKREAVLTVLLIEALPEAGDVTEDDRAAVEEARAYYDALPDGQKEKINGDTLDKLKAAEEALALLDAENAIGALPEGEITLDDRDAIRAARAAYETLTDEQKKNFPAEELEKIVAAEKALAAAEKNKADTEAANDVAETIGDLPATGSVTLTDKAAIDAARAAYDELTDDQKKKVPADVLEKLEAAEAAYKTLDDTAKADAVKALIAEIGAVEYNEETKAKIEAVRAAYEALSGDQKKLVDNYTVLTEAEATYEAKEAEANTPKGLSGAAIAWIVIGSVLVIGIAAFLVFWLVFQKKTLAALFAAIGGFFAGLFGKKKAEAVVEETGHVSKRKNNKRTRRAKKNKAKQARKMRKRNS